MRLYMKQKLMSLKGDFDIYDEDQQPVYHVEGKMFSVGRKLWVYDSHNHEELAYIEQKVMTLLPKMEVYVKGDYVASIVKKLSFFKPKYEVEGLNWSIEGDIFSYDYQILDPEGYLIAQIQKKYFSWSDTFEFNILEDDVDPVMVIAIILAIDAVMDSQN